MFIQERHKMQRIFILVLFSVLLLPAVAHTAPDRDFKPIAGSIKSHKVNVRAGPGTNYPILWVYKMRGYPVRATAHFGGWYKIVDVEGEAGWIYQNFFSTRQTAMVSPGAPAHFYASREHLNPRLLLAQEVIVLLKRCTLGFCEVGINGDVGWVKEERLRLP